MKVHVYATEDTELYVDVIDSVRIIETTPNCIRTLSDNLDGSIQVKEYDIKYILKLEVFP